jgi:hypothetical protein
MVFMILNPLYKFFISWAIYSAESPRTFVLVGAVNIIHGIPMPLLG